MTFFYKTERKYIFKPTVLYKNVTLGKKKQRCM